MMPETHLSHLTLKVIRKNSYPLQSSPSSCGIYNFLPSRTFGFNSQLSDYIKIFAQIVGSKIIRAPEKSHVKKIIPNAVL